jgi:Mg2+-importing ATPase
MDILCSDKTGTLTTGEMVLAESFDPLGRPAERPFRLAYVNSVLETGIRSPLDSAILRRARDLDVGDYRKVDEVPFDFERRRLSVVADRGTERWLITKGAPEPILACCETYEVDDQAASLDPATRHRCRGTFEALSRQGYRVLAVAAGRVASQARYTADDERARLASSDSCPLPILRCPVWPMPSMHCSAMGSRSRF